jgi:hypothetical protein
MASPRTLLLVLFAITSTTSSHVLKADIEVDGSVIDATNAPTSPIKEVSPYSEIAPLSWAAPRIYHYPHFLSQSECDYLINFAKAHPDFNKGKHGRLTSLYLEWDAIYVR